MAQTDTLVPAPASAPDAGPAAAPRSSFLDDLLGNPLVGLSPWILYSIVEGPSRLELSAAVALALAVVILSLNWIRGGTPKLLEYADVAYFAGLAVLVAFASPGTRAWLELWGGEVANLAVFGIAFGSVLLRMPFTLQYAREDVAEEYWHEPEFLRINYLLTWVWVVAFAIEAASGLVGDAVLHDSNNIWTGWIIQTLPLIVAAQFTIWYPNRLDVQIDGVPAGTWSIASSESAWVEPTFTIPARRIQSSRPEIRLTRDEAADAGAQRDYAPFHYWLYQ